jgi:hypothetical protein
MAKLPTLYEPGSLRLEVGAPPEKTAPVDYITAWLRRRMPEFGGHSGALADRVLIVRAETGSGKSTVLPVAIFRLLRSRDTAARLQYRGPGVICTQPRVLTAITLANDVSSKAWNPDMVLSETVGFQTGPVSNRPPTGLIYATAGVLAAQLRNQEDGEIMERYRFIIVDEAHERSLDSDLMLMLLRNFYERNVGNARLPFLLLTSATFNPARYAEYFGVGPGNVVEVKGRAYPIDTVWPEKGTNDYPAAAAAAVLQIHGENSSDPPDRADILVFMPGKAESTAVAEALRKAAPALEAPLLVLVIDREVVESQTGDFLLVFERPDRLPLIGGRRPARRVVVSTVVAETGLTIDTLRYVVDCGWSRAMEVYQPSGAKGLITRPAPRSRIEQRKGRVGRLFPGIFYPLYTKNVHQALEEQQLPEIVSTGAADIYLAVVREQQRQKLRMGQVPEFRVEDMALLDSPPVEALLAANGAAVILGFVSPRAPLPTRWPPAPGPAEPAVARGYGLTPLGHLGASFSRTPMEGVRVLLAGYAWGMAASDLLTAVAMFGRSPTALLAARGRPQPGDTLPPGARALRAALPPYLAARVGGGVAGVVPPSEAEAFYYRAKLVLADDFAEAILLFDAFARQLDASEGDLGAVAAWCEEVGLDFGALVEVAERRDRVADEMIVAGLSPFRAPEARLGAQPADTFTRALIRLKRCLYDGLRHRLLERGPEGEYVTRQGLRVRAPPLLADRVAARLRALRVTGGGEWQPRWLLTDQVRLMPAPQRPEEAAAPLLYAAETNLVCVLDGFVDPDPDFDAPRASAAAKPGGARGRVSRPE